MPSLNRIVLDTNVLLRGLLNPHSAAGRVVDACDQRRVLLLLSKPVLSEYRAVLTAPPIVERYPELVSEKMDLALHRLSYVGELIRRVSVRFEYSRDPRDEKFLELAIAGRATYIVTTDNDLLALAFGRGEAARRFRQRSHGTQVMEPAKFLDELRAN